MSKYRCKCGEEETRSTGVRIRIIDGEVRHDVQCKCGKYMENTEPKTGFPSFKSNRWGQVR
ncbi:MAG: hypothetical protein P8J32_00125 [bacterium]|nr:hypothetical protein [bacterium]